MSYETQYKSLAKEDMEGHEDTDLVRMTLAGDRDAFGVLANRHEEYLRRFLLNRLDGRHPHDGSVDIADIIQQTFQSAYEFLGGYKRNSAFKTWITRIALNKLIDSQRRAEKKELTPKRIQAIGFQNEKNMRNSESALQLLIRSELDEILTQEVALGSPRARALYETEYNGRNYEQVAELHSIPIGTVRSRVHRSKVELREALGSLGIDALHLKDEAAQAFYGYVVAAEISSLNEEESWD